VKILFAGFGGLIRAGGFDVEEVVQEIYQGIMIRNQGSCPFDPSKASFGHYVHMVCGCILNNYHRRVQRYRGLVQEGGVYGWDEDGDLGLVDVGEGAVSETLPVEEASEGLAIADIEARLERGALHRDLAVRLLPLLGDGYSREECARRCGVSVGAVGKAIKFLRESLTA
jgi:DNA-directed RNA polymerase specialized sigma24 family protein